jgi:hypothetical protein
MMPLQSTRYLLQFALWLRLAESYFWAQRCNGGTITDHMRQVAGWAKADLAKWRAATFGA